ncbi:MAG: hypothetical protein ACO1N6_08110 [Microcella sp.]
MRGSSWLRSPWEADPLSWFTSPNLPLAAAAIVLGHGVLVLGPAGQAGSRPLVQAAALALSVISLLWVHVMTRPRRGPLTVMEAAVATAMAGSALVLSAIGYVGEVFALGLWWAPLSVSLLLLALVPYLSAVRLALCGAALIATGILTVLLLVVPDDPTWPPYSAAAIAIFPLIIGTVGGVVMIRTITSSIARWNERPLEVVASPLPDEGALVEAVDAATTERVASARAFISAVLARGEVTAGDTMRAAAIAERLRSELTGEVDRTWLERVAEGRAVIIDDPERLVEQLDLAQRTAVRALLDALLGSTDAPAGSARVELRRTDAGAIAVALRIRSSLPEGRRETFLAPYYVTLQSTVDNLRWRTGAVTAVEFEVHGGAGRSARVQRTPEPGTPGGPVAH